MDRRCWMLTLSAAMTLFSLVSFGCSRGGDGDAIAAAKKMAAPTASGDLDQLVHDARDNAKADAEATN